MFIVHIQFAGLPSYHLSIYLAVFLGFSPYWIAHTGSRSSAIRVLHGRDWDMYLLHGFPNYYSSSNHFCCQQFSVAFFL